VAQRPSFEQALDGGSARYGAPLRGAIRVSLLVFGFVLIGQAIQALSA
jgi:hypothetical protein